MRTFLFFGLLGAFTSLADAAPPVTSIEMSNFKFTPHTIELRAGVPVVLHLTNLAGGGHNFSAPEFFASAELDARSATLVHDGRVEVPAQSAVDIQLVPTRGQYAVKCTHTLHSSLGMKGTIEVNP